MIVTKFFKPNQSNPKNSKYYFIMFAGGIIFFVLLFTFGFRMINQINTNDKNQDALRAVINSLFTCPDPSWVHNFENNTEMIEAGDVTYTKDSIIDEEYNKKLKETYSPYFTEKMYQSFIPLYVNFNQTSAYWINYQVEVDHIDFVQDKKDSRSYTFTIYINYGPSDGNMKMTEVTGKAQCLEKGKISFLRFYENFYDILINTRNRELTIENVIMTIFNCPNQELIKLNEVMLEESNQTFTNGEDYAFENSELYQKQDELYENYFIEKAYLTFVRSTMPLRYHFDADTLGYKIIVDQVDITQSEQFDTNYSFTVDIRYGHSDDDWKEYKLEGSAQFPEQFSKLSYLQIFNHNDFNKLLWDSEATNLN